MATLWKRSISWRKTGRCGIADRCRQASKKFVGMLGAVGLIRLAAFQGHRRAEAPEGHALYPFWPGEIEDGAPKQGGQVQGRGIQVIDTGVVGVGARVVVDIDAGKNAPLLHLLKDGLGHGVLGGGAGAPNTVVVRLAIQPPLLVAGSLHVANEEGKGAGQFPLGSAEVAAEELPHRLPTGGFVAVQQHRDKQGRIPSPRQMDEGRPTQLVVELMGL